MEAANPFVAETLARLNVENRCLGASARQPERPQRGLFARLVRD